MALSKSANTYNRQNWEQSEFPLLCQTCLGDNPYIRMIKDSYGDECRICARPYTVFRWCPGAKMRYKRTEVCQSCAQLKNVCQTCLLDLEYGLPVQARDSVLNVTDTLPKSDVGREYYLQNMEQKIAESGRAEPGGGGGKAPNDLLLKMSRTGPYYKRNRPHICSFWVKGECSRGEECPYRHEMPTDPNDPLSNQKIKDRYHGVNDPVAEKLLSSAQDLPTLSPPDDKTVTSLYIGGIDESFNQSDLRDQFYAFGEIMSIHMVTKSRYAFVTFSTRAAAEKAADSTFNKLIVKGRRLKVLWGKAQTTPSLGVKGQQTLAPVPGLPAAPPPLPFDPFGLSSKATPPPPPGGFPPPPRPPQISHVLGSHPPHVSQLLGPPPPPPGFPPPAGGYYPPPPSRGFPPLGPRPPTLHYPSQSPLHLGAKK